MGRKVNVVLPSGQVVAVDEQIAKDSQLSRDAGAQLTAQGVAESNAEQSSGVVEGAKAFGEGAADAATFGAYGAIRGAVDPEGAETMRIRAQERGGARFAGELAPAIAGGFLGPAATGAGALARAANTAVGAGRAGAALEGAIYGVGGYVASTNVTGDPLTIESAIAAATIGGVLDVGFKVAADKLEGMAWNNKLRTAKQGLEAEEAQLASKGKAVFKDTPPSWNEFVELHEARKAATKSYNKEVAKEAAAYAEHLTPAGLNDTMAGFEKARTGVLAEFQAIPEVRDALAAHSKATKSFEQSTRAYDKLATNNEAFTKKLNGLQEILDKKKGEFAPRGAPDDIYKVKSVGRRGAISAEGRFQSMGKGSNYQTGRLKPPIGEKLEAEIKEYAERISQIMRKKGGGYRREGNDWVPDSSVPGDVDGAMRDAAELSRDMAKKFGGKEVPHIPFKPTAPVEPTFSIDPAVNARIQSAKDIGKGINDAKTLMRQGKYEDASLVLGDMRARVSAAAKDLDLPNLPLRPRTPLPELAGDLPKSIDDFARKHVDQVNELAQQLDPTSHEALMRAMKDIDVKIKGNPAEDLTGLHKTLREYRGAVTAAELKAAKAAAEGEKQPAILKLINRAARAAGARSADVGGTMGGFTRTMGGAAVNRGMTAIEGAALGYAVSGDPKGAAMGAALMTGRMGMIDKLRNLVTKYGVPVAGAMRKVGSPLAYLKNSFPSGQVDPETDHRKLAVNRIHEIQSAAMAAPDAAFLAVQGMLGDPDDIAWKMHQHVVGSLNYLASTLPRDPGTDTKMFHSNWSPAYHETVALAHRLEAASDPLTAIARAIAGDSHPAATETLWAIYPAIMNELAQELSVAAPNLKNLTYEQASAYSNLFRTPLTGLQQPVVVSTIQGNYMMGAQSAAPPPPGPKGGGAKQAPGRPAAVQSPVAGSSPGNLTGR